jgi:hypothetical protein
MARFKITVSNEKISRLSDAEDILSGRVTMSNSDLTSIQVLLTSDFDHASQIRGSQVIMLAVCDHTIRLPDVGYLPPQDRMIAR